MCEREREKERERKREKEKEKENGKDVRVSLNRGKCQRRDPFQCQLFRVCVMMIGANYSVYVS